MKQLGNRLRTLREGLGISQAKFAEIIGSTQSSHSYCRAFAKVCGLFRCIDGLHLRSLRRAARQAVSSKASGGKQPGTRKVCGDVF